MPISDEGLVSGSVNRAELVAAYAAATDAAVKENLAAAGAAHGMQVEDDKLVDPSAPEEYEAESQPEPEAEPEAEAGEEVSEPPRSGAGSGRDAWVAYAGSVGVEVTDDMTRDDIIAAVERAEEE